MQKRSEIFQNLSEIVKKSFKALILPFSWLDLNMDAMPPSPDVRRHRRPPGSLHLFQTLIAWQLAARALTQWWWHHRRPHGREWHPGKATQRHQRSETVPGVPWHRRHAMAHKWWHTRP